jgi:hypothetical protein
MLSKTVGDLQTSSISILNTSGTLKLRGILARVDMVNSKNFNELIIKM